MLRNPMIPAQTSLLVALTGMLLAACASMPPTTDHPSGTGPTAPVTTTQNVTRDPRTVYDPKWGLRRP